MITITEQAVNKLDSIKMLKSELIRDGKLSIIKGETEHEKVWELYYLDQIGNHITVHYDTEKDNGQAIQRNMNIDVVVV